MGLKGTRTGRSVDPMMRSSFRTAFVQPEGRVGAHIIECVITGVNTSAWTVDVASKYDQLYYGDIQVASPYLHPNRGEGVYVLPEVGAKGMVCIPSDGPPPFLLCFIMPVEQTPLPPVPEGDETSAEDNQSNYTFAGGRTRGKPGDIIMRGRDGNFVALHRGGVLQVGSTELSQRLYIPLQNLIEDISQNYRHYNVGGTMSWGVRAGSPDDALETRCMQTMRLFADQKEATIRICKGTFEAMAEPEDGWQEDMAELGIGSEPIIYEVTVSPEGFSAEEGIPNAGAVEGTTLRFLFDKAGGAFLGARGSVMLGIKGKLKIVAEDDIYIESKKSITLKAGTTFRLEGGDALDLGGKVTKVNGGSKPVAHVGSQILITTTVPIPIVVGGTPGTITAGAVFSGSVSTGNPTIQV